MNAKVLSNIERLYGKKFRMFIQRALQKRRQKGSITEIFHNLQMYGTYIIPNQKFNSIRISVIRNLTKIWDKSCILEMSRTFILQNNNS